MQNKDAIVFDEIDFVGCCDVKALPDVNYGAAASGMYAAAVAYRPRPPERCGAAGRAVELPPKLRA